MLGGVQLLHWLGVQCEGTMKRALYVLGMNEELCTKHYCALTSTVFLSSIALDRSLKITNVIVNKDSLSVNYYDKKILFQFLL